MHEMKPIYHLNDEVHGSGERSRELVALETSETTVDSVDSGRARKRAAPPKAEKPS